MSIHHGHAPEIEITSDTTAKGRWQLYDCICNIPAKTAFMGWGYYEDEYVKEQGKWKIKITKISHMTLKAMLTTEPRFP